MLRRAWRLLQPFVWRRLSAAQWCLLFSVAAVLAGGVVLLAAHTLPKAQLVFASDGEGEGWVTAPPELSVTDDELVACVRRWLETDGVGADAVVPFAIVPLTLEWELFRSFMCRVDVRVRHLYLVQNGAVEELTAVLRKLRAAVPSDRLRVEHRPQNVGYAGAVNEGFRVALRMPRDEVPFVAVFNCDVYFERGYFDRYVPAVYAMLRPDAARVRALEAEVAAEEAAARVAGRRTLRASAGDIPGLVTSALLPDRVRYGDAAAQRRAFEEHVGMFHYVKRSMCAYMVSRLALLVGGLLDENCYPAYFEDYDWQLRVDSLGFKWYTGAAGEHGRFYHGIGANVRVIDEGPVGKSLSYTIEATRVLRMMKVRPGLDYGETKWLWHRAAGVPLNRAPFAQLGFVVPVDVWVLDVARQQLVIDIGTARRPAVEIADTYNLSLLQPLRQFAQQHAAP